ncbi:MAG TPA: hypothetical protein VEC16_00140 [Alphaproteobacteria bacterium]|nr:hypothetical protein [Alphaproteobacteria bacterium]
MTTYENYQKNPELKGKYETIHQHPQERLRNLLGSLTSLAQIMEEESKNGFKDLKENQSLQKIVSEASKNATMNIEAIKNYLHDIPIFYKKNS